MIYEDIQSLPTSGIEWTLEKAKSILGITGTTQDVEVELAMLTSMAIAESYCNRKFLRATDNVEFHEHSLDHVLDLKRYPIVQVKVTDLKTDTEIPATAYSVYNNHGLVKLRCINPSYTDLAVEVTGGYELLPGDVGAAMYGILQTYWNSKGGSTVAPGAIDSITIPDVGTVRFNNGNTSSSSSGGSGLMSQYGSSLSLLDSYRSIPC
jgi:hypothetical protein